ncbi:MAG: DUF1501 domain-containing protein, partial [Candidatus Hydrogenedentes bacterium]|nr:DUF1501 domain-containing protein [Candidatus Hydrogenedentota bacterium]
MNPLGEHAVMHTRRQFFGRCACGIGTAALGSLLSPSLFAETRTQHVLGSPHFAPKAKRIIYLFQSGGPSQLDLFDFKPTVQANHGAELPPSVRGNQRLTTMTSGQTQFPVVAS